MNQKRIKKNDRVFLTIVSVVILILFFCLYGPWSARDGAAVEVTVDGEVFGCYRLNENRTIEITDKKGRITNILEIRDGYADMKKADCPDKLCVKQEKIRRAHENIVCLPNRVVVTVQKDEDKATEAAPDAVAN